MVNFDNVAGIVSVRTPKKRVKTSNGHSRGGAPIFSVLHLMSVDKKKEGESEALKKRMLKLCKDRALPYGIIVKNRNTIVLMSDNYEYHLLLRWRNHAGILNPAWQISPYK